MLSIGAGKPETLKKCPEVALRKFPYPYRAAFTICNDTDDTETSEELEAVHRFLNGPASDGGLELGVGDSLWMYNQLHDLLERPGFTPDHNAHWFSGNAPIQGISYFKGMSDRPSKAADCLETFLQNGEIDCLHSYGHFAAAGFTRRHAEKALEKLRELGGCPDVWVNHGGPENHQNMGPAEHQHGDNPDNPAYHSDLTLDAGVRFAWTGHFTHAIGQNGSPCFENRVKMLYEGLRMQTILKKKAYICDNRLVHERKLADGRWVFDFVRYVNRWGRTPSACAEDIPRQIPPGVIDTLIRRNGYMILYTHLGDNPYKPGFSPGVASALRYVSNRKRSGDLWVTTTRDLLRYYVSRYFLHWSASSDRRGVRIQIHHIESRVTGRFVPLPEDLSGLTFYVPLRTTVSVFAGNRRVPVRRNPVDNTHRPSVTLLSES